MALIKCPECGRQISTLAKACPSCGFPLEGLVDAPPAPSKKILCEIRPSWWLYFWHVLFCWLVVPILVAWWRRASVVLQILPGRLVLSRGMFSKCYREFMARDIRAIDIDQSFINRLVDIGSLTISTAATVDADERIDGIPHPHAVRDLILAQRGDE